MSKLTKAALALAGIAIGCIVVSLTLSAAYPAKNAQGAGGLFSDRSGEAHDRFGVDVDGDDVEVNLPGLSVRVNGDGVNVNGDLGGSIERLVRLFDGLELSGERISGADRSGLDATRTSVDFWRERGFRIANAESVDIDCGTADVVIESSMGDECRVRFEGRVKKGFENDIALECSKTGRVLKIGIREPEGFSLWNDEYLKLVVSLPTGVKLALVELDSSTGDCVLGKVAADRVSISSSTGDLSVLGVESPGLELSSSTGDVTVELDASIGYRYRVSAATGGIDVGDRHSGAGALEGTLGDGSGNLEISASTGDVRVTLD